MRYSEMMVNRMTEIIKYDEMKSTREQWLGEIPASWGTLRLKRIFTIKKDIAGEEGHTVLSVTQKGIRPKVMSEKGQFALDYSKYQLVNRGEFVMNHMDLLTGWVDISDYDGVTSPDYRVFVNSDPSKYDSSYYRYIFQLCYSARIFYGLGQGVAGFGRWRLPADMFLNFGLPVPPIGEQHSIAAYLDDRVSQIDSIIEEERASIEEYKQWKKSVIFEAVTKGLNRNVTMKDSEISWIGDVPASWNIRKIKNGFSIVSGATPKSDKKEYWDGDVIWITPADYKTEDKYIRGGRRNLSDEGYSSCGTTVVPVGSLIFSKRAPVGTVAINSVPLCTNQGCLSCIPNSTADSEYFYYAMSVFTEQFELFSSGTTFKEISANAFANFTLPCPPIAEQKEIAKYLSVKCSEIDDIRREKQALIDDMEAYKRSLIYEAVTGKRKVV